MIALHGTTALWGIALTLLLTALPNSALAQAITGVDRIVYGPTLVDGFRRPSGLAIDADRGILVIADTGNHRVALFDAMGRSRGALSWESHQNSAAGAPRCTAIDKRGRLFVLDGTTGIIEVLSSAGSRLGHVEPEIPPAVIGRTRPQFFSLAPSGACYVLYAGEVSGIAVVQPNGSTSRVIGFESPDRTFFESPVALAVDAKESRIVVIDPKAAHQVKVCGPDGRLLHSFGEHGEGQGTFGLPVFVTWGPSETLWIVDTMRHSVSVFDADGTYRTRLLGFGREPGQVSYPAACGFLDAERFVVLERAGARFQILEIESPISEVSDLDFMRSASGGSGADELN